MESEVLKTGMNLIMEKQIIPNPICPNGCIYRLIHYRQLALTHKFKMQSKAKMKKLSWPFRTRKKR